jgi:hypothetical protein
MYQIFIITAEVYESVYLHITPGDILNETLYSCEVTVKYQEIHTHTHYIAVHIIINVFFYIKPLQDVGTLCNTCFNVK